jgi:hypothetical protein
MSIALQRTGDQLLPFGDDALTLIWIATAFHIENYPASNELRFASAADVLRACGRAPVHGERVGLRKSLERLYSVCIDVRDRRDPARLRASKIGFIDELDVWFHGDENQRCLWANRIHLNAVFADLLREHRVPTAWEDIVALGAGARKLYLWETWRSFRLKKAGGPPARVPIIGPTGLMHEIGSRVSCRDSKVRAQFDKWHAEVMTVWPKCPNRRVGDVLLVYPAQAIPEGLVPRLPGVSANPPPLVEVEGMNGEKRLRLVRKNAALRDKD